MAVPSCATSFKGAWFSDFVSPTKNLHYFILTLGEPSDSKVTPAKMTLVADRAATDGRILSVTYRVHVEIHGPFLAILAKDAKKKPDCLNTMVLKLNDHGELCGIFSWNSLSSGQLKSKNVRWARNPSLALRHAYAKAKVALPKKRMRRGE